jgi:hypothetical protein
MVIRPKVTSTLFVATASMVTIPDVPLPMVLLTGPSHIACKDNKSSDDDHEKVAPLKKSRPNRKPYTPRTTFATSAPNLKRSERTLSPTTMSQTHKPIYAPRQVQPRRRRRWWWRRPRRRQRLMQQTRQWQRQWQPRFQGQLKTSRLLQDAAANEYVYQAQHPNHIFFTHLLYLLCGFCSSISVYA